MRRLLVIFGLLAALAALVATSATGQDDDPGTYKIRAYFDNAGFLVTGLDVRIAGANVGSVDEVTVSLPGEAVKEDGSEDPGKAVAVLNITDPSFKDFLTDASCLIRPQSLLGEKYVECVPTQPRAPGSEAPPELPEIADGEIGAGQYFLPIENNGKQVDLDLVNNITREPEVARFRLILNDLGAGLAARGPDLAEVIRRANPALEQTDKVLATLAKQNKQLADLARDSDTILTPLSREREALAGFIRNAAIAGTASAERSNDIVAGFDEFPNALRELQSTMVELQRFSEAATPVASDLRRAAPGLTGATQALQPFSKAATISLTNLGDNTAAASDDLAGSAPVIRQLRKVADTSIPGIKNLRLLLNTFRRTGGTKQFTDFALNTSNVLNGFDTYGHYIRAQLQTVNCVEFVTSPVTGCDAAWSDIEDSAASASAAAQGQQTILNQLLDGAELSQEGEVIPAGEGGPDATPSGGDATTASTGGSGSTKGASAKGNQDLLEFLIGDAG